MKKQSKHLIPNILTLFNMFIGFLAIGLIINNQPVIYAMPLDNNGEWTGAL